MPAVSAGADRGGRQIDRVVERGIILMGSCWKWPRALRRAARRRRRRRSQTGAFDADRPSVSGFKYVTSPPGFSGTNFTNWEVVYNTIRPHQALGQLTPTEWLQRHHPELFPQEGTA